jgi:PhnB protein
MLHASPYLLFDGDCAEAMTFYRDALGGSLVLTKLGDTPMKAQFPPGMHARIINAQLTSDDLEISASDWMASPAFEPLQGNMTAIYVESSDAEELRALFAKLSVGADRARLQELHPMPFGLYGQLYDRYGVQWILRGPTGG